MSEIKYVTPSGLAHYDEKIKEVIDEVDTSTNTKVTQTPTSTDASYPLLLSPSGQTQETNTTSYFNSGVVLNPSTKTISADIDGNAKTATSADSATKATQDGNGNVITDTYLSLKGGTMDKGASIIVPYTVNDDRYIEITGHTIMNYLPSNAGYAGGLNWYDQSNNVLGSIGLYGSKGIPEYYYVGDYSDPFVKVDMEGNTTIKKNLNGLTTLLVQKSDATGYPSYLLAFDITDWFLNGSHSKRGFNGHVYSDRSGGYMGQEEVAIVIMDCGYTKATTIGQTLRLTTNNGNYRPCMIHDTVNDKYYLALKISGQDRRLYFHGKVNGTMSTTQIKATDDSGTLPTGYEFVFDPANCTMGMGVSSSCSGNAATATSASNIANNLTTTVEGYALDARQGKALQDKLGSTDISKIGDGTVTNAINTINSNLAAHINLVSQQHITFTLTNSSVTKTITLPTCSGISLYLVAALIVCNNKVTRQDMFLVSNVYGNESGNYTCSSIVQSSYISVSNVTVNSMDMTFTVPNNDTIWRTDVYIFDLLR